MMGHKTERWARAIAGAGSAPGPSSDPACRRIDPMRMEPVDEGARPSRPERRAHGSGGMKPPGPPQEVGTESSSPRAKLGRFPRSPLAGSEGRGGSPHSGDPPGGRRRVCAGTVRRAGNRPSAVWWPVSTNLCLRSDRSALIIDRGRSPRSCAAGRIKSAGGRDAQGRRAFTTDCGAALSQWHGGRLGRHDSWDGPRSTAVARPVRHRPELEHLDDRCLLSSFGQPG